MSERQYILIGFLAFIIGILIAIYTTVLNELSVEGAQLQRLQLETAAIKKDNMLIKEQVIHEKALSTIEAKARAQGFKEAKQYIYLR